MPNKDGTGPNGNGPRTGRGKGNCRGKRRNDDCPGCGRGRIGSGLSYRNRND